MSQIEKGTRPASVADVRLWCRVCGATGQRTDELLAEQAAIARLWISFRDLGRKTGLYDWGDHLDNVSAAVAFSSDPRTLRDVTAAFEIAWDRATPHAEYKTGLEPSQ